MNGFLEELGDPHVKPTEEGFVAKRRRIDLFDFFFVFRLINDITLRSLQCKDTEAALAAKTSELRSVVFYFSLLNILLYFHAVIDDEYNIKSFIE